MRYFLLSVTLLAGCGLLGAEDSEPEPTLRPLNGTWAGGTLDTTVAMGFELHQNGTADSVLFIGDGWVFAPPGSIESHVAGTLADGRVSLTLDRVEGVPRYRFEGRLDTDADVPTDTALTGTLRIVPDSTVAIRVQKMP